MATNNGNMTLATVTVTDPNVSNLDVHAGQRSPAGPGRIDHLHGDATRSPRPTSTPASYFNHGLRRRRRRRCRPGVRRRRHAGRPEPAPDASSRSATETSYDAVGDVITLHDHGDQRRQHDARRGDRHRCERSNLGPARRPTARRWPRAPRSPARRRHTVTQADIDAGHYLNTACVDDGAGGAAQACDDADVPADLEPAPDDHQGRRPRRATTRSATSSTTRSSRPTTATRRSPR